MRTRPPACLVDNAGGAEGGDEAGEDGDPFKGVGAAAREIGVGHNECKKPQYGHDDPGCGSGHFRVYGHESYVPFFHGLEEPLNQP